MIVQHDVVARLELAGLAPLGRHADRGRVFAIATQHRMIRGEAQRIAFARRQLQDRLAAGGEEARPAPMRTAAPSIMRDEWLAEQFRDLARPVRGLHPGVGRDARVGGADRLAVMEIVPRG